MTSRTGATVAVSGPPRGNLVLRQATFALNRARVPAPHNRRSALGSFGRRRCGQAAQIERSAPSGLSCSPQQTGVLTANAANATIRPDRARACSVEEGKPWGENGWYNSLR